MPLVDVWKKTPEQLDGKLRHAFCSLLLLGIPFVCGLSAEGTKPTLPPYQVIVDEQPTFISVECHFYQPASPQTVEAILRTELTKLSADRIRRREVMAIAWLRNAHEKDLEDWMPLPDGSVHLFLIPQSGEIVTEKQKAASEMPSVSPNSVIDVRFTITGRRSPNGGIDVVGRTNLPDGCAIMVSFVNGGDAKAIVRNGRFEAGSFTHLGESYPAGTYSIEIVVPFAMTQSKAVQEKIGTKGERLGGPYAGIGTFGRTVKYTGTITVD